jgi:hypothetical protein
MLPVQSERKINLAVSGVNQNREKCLCKIVNDCGKKQRKNVYTPPRFVGARHVYPEPRRAVPSSIATLSEHSIPIGDDSLQNLSGLPLPRKIALRAFAWPQNRNHTTPLFLFSTFNFRRSTHLLGVER